MSREQTIEAGAEPVESGEVALTDKFVTVASESKGLEAFDRTFYRKKWSFKVKNGVLSRLLLENNTLYFGAEGGSFYSVEREHRQTQLEVCHESSSVHGSKHL